ncbi:ornithine cyclodeaminase family protein [Desulfovibrionales bacterium]
MYFVSEEIAAQVVSMPEAIDAIETMFQDHAQGLAEVFPVVMGHGPQEGSFFSMKAGLMQAQGIVGLKVGSYWPGNRAQGSPAHASSTLLLDPATGYAKALVAASYLTSLRTAAADAVAVRWLSRKDSTVLTLLGAGHQAWFELLAVREVRPIATVLVVNRCMHTARIFAQRIREELGLDAQALDMDQAVPQADILVTVTAARQALFPAHLVRPGTHISAMGADNTGKQELDPKLVASARLFADVVQQSCSVGEYEAAFRADLITPEQITTLGSVIQGGPGRRSAADITIFDSSGMALQDLTICALALEKAVALGLAHHVGEG